MQVPPRLSNGRPWVDLDLFYAKVKFGYIGFCMGENENYLFFGNYCSLRSFVWEKMKIIYFLETIAALGLKVAFGLHTQVSDSGPQVPLVLLQNNTPLFAHLARRAIVSYCHTNASGVCRASSVNT